ncbi:MAG TPA: SpoIIE family protein phosphatase [Thermoleophilia bacterium]|nr:SpoIIE family protein phosphatase [Thermoleophilia bacterium]
MPIRRPEPHRVFVNLGELLRPHRWVVLLLTFLVELAVLGALGTVHGEDAAVAVAVSLMVLAAVVAGALAGPLVGAAAAFVGGAVFYPTVAHFGTDQSLPATAASTAIWMLAAVLSGIVAESLREQAREREEATVALTHADAVRQTAEHLLEATAGFHRGLSPRRVCNEVCRVALGSFECASVALALVEETDLRVVAVAPRLPLGAGQRISLLTQPMLARVLELGRPEADAAARLVSALGADAGALFPAGPPSGDVAFVPLHSSGKPLALLIFEWAGRADRPDHERPAALQRFADQAAVALLEARRAQAAGEAERLHATLEASLLPVMPVAHDDLHIVTAYRPGEERLLLGGDFYDVMRLPDGRLALIVGDVAGHGPDAAALGTRLRAGWQALTLSAVAPPAIFASLTRMVAAQPPVELFATVVLAWIDPAARTAEFLSAGHPAPLLLSSDVRPVELPVELPLGLDESAVPSPTTIELPPDWTLFFYTDGLIEARAAPGSCERFGVERLMQRLQDSDEDFDAAALDCLLAEVESANGAAFGDDVAVVAVSGKRQTSRPIVSIAEDAGVA